MVECNIGEALGVNLTIKKKYCVGKITRMFVVVETGSRLGSPGWSGTG